MNVLLISSSNENIYTNRGEVARMPVGVAALAAMLEKANHRVTVIDREVDNINDSEIVNIAKAENIYVVGISSVSANFPEASALCRLFRSETNLPVVIGGPHVTALPEASLKETGARAAVCGEADEIISPLIDALTSGKSHVAIPGTLFYDGNHLSGSFSVQRVKSLDLLPFPARHLFDMNLYRNRLDGKLAPQASIITARGCPGNCGFCSAASAAVYARSPENVVDEMLSISNEYGIANFGFFDDTLTFNKKRFLKLAALMKERLPGIKYECHVQLKPLDEETVSALLESGCVLVRPGIESGNNDILRDMGKNITTEQILSRTDLLHRMGLPFRATYILGWVDESVEQAENTIEFARRVNAEISSFSIATPLPGTRLWREAESRGMITTNLDLRNLAFYDRIFANLSHIPDSQLLELQRKANSRC